MEEKQSQGGEKLAELEALLFVHGEPLSYKRIAELLRVGENEAEGLVEGLKAELALTERGLALVSLGRSVQFSTKPQFGALLEQFVKEELREDLSPASLETLAIISYFGPISRSRLEYLRGVNSSFILRSLRLRGLVERTQDPHHPNSFLYDVSFDCLKHLGVAKKEELPDYDRFQTLLGEAEKAEVEAGGKVSAAMGKTSADE